MTRSLNRGFNDSTSLAAPLGNETLTTEAVCDEIRLGMTPCYQVNCCQWNETTSSFKSTCHICCNHATHNENLKMVLIGFIACLLICLLFSIFYYIYRHNIVRKCCTEREKYKDLDSKRLISSSNKSVKIIVDGKHNQVIEKSSVVEYKLSSEVVCKDMSNASSFDLKEETEVDNGDVLKEQLELQLISNSSRGSVEKHSMNSFSPNELYEYFKDRLRPMDSKRNTSALSSVRSKVEKVLDMTVSSSGPSEASDQFGQMRPNSTHSSLSSLSEYDVELDITVADNVMGFPGVKQQVVTQDSRRGKNGLKKKRRRKRKKRKCSIMVTKWLQPIPEKEYTRVIYVGKLQIVRISEVDPNSGDENDIKTMISDIWKTAQEFNRSNFISGHLSFTKGLHCAQLLEGTADMVDSLMERIRKDNRVVIFKEFKKRVLTMKSEFKVSMCYAFDEITGDMALRHDPNVSLGQFFENLANSYEIQRSGWNLREFYRSTVEKTLIKYITLDLLNGES